MTWTTVTADSGNVGLASSIALDSSYKQGISYSDNTNSRLKYAKWSGTHWDVETVDSVESGGDNSSIKFDSADYPRIAYAGPGSGTLKYAAWNGSSWDIETVDSGEAAVGGYISLALDSSNNARISYLDSTNNALKYAAWNGSSWDIETVYDTTYVSGYTSICLDSDEYPNISFSGSGKGTEALKFTRWNGSAWVKADGSAGVDDITSEVNFFTSVALDSDGYPLISYRDGSTDDLNYAAWNGSSWDIETVDDTSASVGGNSSLVLGLNDRPTISYVDATNDKLKYARYNGSLWEITVVTSLPPNVGAGSLAVGLNDAAYISFKDAAGVGCALLPAPPYGRTVPDYTIVKGGTSSYGVNRTLGDYGIADRDL